MMCATKQAHTYRNFFTYQMHSEVNTLKLSVSCMNSRILAGRALARTHKDSTARVHHSKRMLSVDNAQCHIPPKMDDSKGCVLAQKERKISRKPKASYSSEFIMDGKNRFVPRVSPV